MLNPKLIVGKNSIKYAYTSIKVYLKPWKGYKWTNLFFLGHRYSNDKQWVYVNEWEGWTQFPSKADYSSERVIN